MPGRTPNLFQNQSKIWKFVGSLSAIIGLVCFALSSTFKQFFGGWDFLKFLLYLLISLIILCIALYARRIQVSGSFLVKGHVIFFIFFLISVYSVLHDKAVSGKPDALSIISYGSFALMSLSMSRKFELGFETGLFNFFLGCFTVQLMKISWILSLIAGGFSYVLVNFRCYSDSQLEIGPTSPEDHLALAVGHADGVDRGNDNEDVNGETPDSPRIAEVSGESISTDNHRNSEEDENFSSLSFQTEPPNQYNVSSGSNMVTIENGWMQSFPEPESTPPWEFTSTLRMRRNQIQNHSSSYAHVEEIPPIFQTCGFCKGHLVPGQDIYMYRGDTAFCNLECREQQMKQDEENELKEAFKKKYPRALAVAGIPPPTATCRVSAKKEWEKK